MVVCDDADLNIIVPIAMRGVFQNMGQNCIGIERIYCAAPLYDQFCERVGKIAREMRQGLPLAAGSDCGALVMPAQIDIVDGLVKDAVSKGARVLAGGERNAQLAPGQFYKPTVLCNVNHSMRIVHEEVFGPVMLIIKTHSDEEAVRMANDSKYALAGSVFSNSRDRAFKIARQIQGGTVLVNDFGIAYLCQELPFGGVGFSGFGKFNGPEGLRECCNQKVLMNDRFSFLKSQIPKPLQYVLPFPLCIFVTLWQVPRQRQRGGRRAHHSQLDLRRRRGAQAGGAEAVRRHARRQTQQVAAARRLAHVVLSYPSCVNDIVCCGCSARGATWVLCR
jgi:delta 1-pyrroline-5-carboxylate dehydrogenase